MIFFILVLYYQHFIFCIDDVNMRLLKKKDQKTFCIKIEWAIDTEIPFLWLDHSGFEVNGYIFIILSMFSDSPKLKLQVHL